MKLTKKWGACTLGNCTEEGVITAKVYTDDDDQVTLATFIRCPQHNVNDGARRAAQVWLLRRRRAGR